jgi:hypothetical protein
VKLDHTGIHASRCEHPSSALEKAFAEQWRNENKTFGVLDALMRAADTVDQNVFSPLGDSRPYQFADGVTQRDATVAASIIQWLGSNVGRCFLEEALKRAGYQLIRTGRSVRDDPSDTGLALVEFVSRRRDGAPLWINAKLQAFASVGKPERKGASPAELDILHRRHLAETISGMKPSNGYAHIVGALAEIHEEMRDLVRQLPEREQRRLNEIAQLHPSRFEREAKAAIKKWEAIREHDSNPPVGPNTRRRLERQRDEIADAFDAREEKHG